jgi:hypothetical protein
MKFNRLIAYINKFSIMTSLPVLYCIYIMRLNRSKVTSPDILSFEKLFSNANDLVLLYILPLSAYAGKGLRRKFNRSNHRMAS